jgi:Cof subfamily protein (haloacid dehalogenase superfamily)
VKAFPFKLAAVDVDDTLLAPDKTVSAENLRALRRLEATGCRVVLATGRRHSRLGPLYAQLGLDDFAISCQGARVQHVRTGQILHSASMGPARSAELLSYGMARGWTVMLWDEAGIYSPNQTRWAEAYVSQTGNDRIETVSVEALHGRPFEKIVWVGESVTAERAAMETSETTRGLRVTPANGWCLEFAAAGAYKAEGAAALARAASLSSGDVIAFGDGLNDIDLFRWAGSSVAMAHAEEAVSTCARLVSPAGDPATAFARAVESLLS